MKCSPARMSSFQKQSNVDIVIVWPLFSAQSEGR